MVGMAYAGTEATAARRADEYRLAVGVNAGPGDVALHRPAAMKGRLWRKPARASLFAAVGFGDLRWVEGGRDVFSSVPAGG
jgi:hypothetical protein